MKPLLIALILLAATPVQAQQKDMTFFITSAGPGKGADLGGLAGADAHCQSLAKAAGAGPRDWRAYLSTRTRVNARDRIGKGPWKNAKGEEIAKSVDDLHANSRINKQTGAGREGRAGQRPRRYAEPARHPHRLAGRRPRHPGRQGHDLRQLDQERRGHARWSAITTASACATTTPRSRGTPRTRRAAAARTSCAARAATA